jgi:alkaline phosphatase
MPRLLPCALALFAAVLLPGRADPPAIVLVISDGTSQELLTAARIYAHGASGRLDLESFPHTAIVRTHSLEDAVTDSSAAATAMARGIKAENRCVGMATPNAAADAPSLLDLARRAGWSTGVVTDDSVTGATPASFLVEHKSRWEEAEIAAKIVDALGRRADIVLGGGAKWFRPGRDLDETQRAVAAATASRLAKGNVAVFDEWRPLADALAQGESRPVLGTLSPVEFPFYADAPRVPRIADLAVAAARFLRAKGQPFFLMVEAALPDKACHRGQAKRAVVEVLELDRMVAELRKALPPDSLVLVTTDHNTGGLAINGPPVPVSLRGDALLGENPLTRASILSWATGPGANLEASNRRAPAISPPSKSPVPEKKIPSDPDYQQPAAIPGNAATHTGGDVWLLGVGPGSEAVHGYLDNTDIFRLIAGRLKAASK